MRSVRRWARRTVCYRYPSQCPQAASPCSSTAGGAAVGSLDKDQDNEQREVSQFDHSAIKSVVLGR